MATTSENDRQKQIRSEGAMRAIRCMARIAGVSVAPRLRCPPEKCARCQRRSFVFVEDVCGHCWSFAVLSFSLAKTFTREASAVPRLHHIGKHIDDAGSPRQQQTE
jgi:hypothetical protein